MHEAEILVPAAKAAARYAYAPYSGFAVGAALLLNDGTILTAANIENASYGLSLCAEAVALGMASSQGRLHHVVAIAIAGGMLDANGEPTGTDPINPCGRCRQMINEAAQLGARDMPVICASAEGESFRIRAISELLPDAFGPANLNLPEQSA